MKLSNKVVRSALGVLAAVAVLGGTIYINRTASSTTADPNGAAVTKKATPNPHIAVSGWLPYYDDGSGLTTFKTYAKSFTELHSFSFHATSATKIELQGNVAHNASVQSAIKKAKVQNIPTLTEEMNTADFSAVINDPVQREAHAKTVCDWVVNNDYDGVDIDYEVFVLNLNSVSSAALAPSFTALMSSTANCLHQHKKVLQVTVLPRTGDPRYAYFENHLAVPVFDYAALGQVVDFINPMAYDYSYPGSAPGSVDPIEWVKAVVKYTTDRVQPLKINLALPLYGYNWVAKGTASTMSNSEFLATKYNVTPTRDLASQSSVFTFTDPQANNHTVWYDNAEQVAMRVQVARDAGLRGVIFWTIGSESANTWNTIITPR